MKRKHFKIFSLLSCKFVQQDSPNFFQMIVSFCVLCNLRCRCYQVTTAANLEACRTQNLMPHCRKQRINWVTNDKSGRITKLCREVTQSWMSRGGGRFMNFKGRVWRTHQTLKSCGRLFTRHFYSFNRLNSDQNVSNVPIFINLTNLPKGRPVFLPVSLCQLESSSRVSDQDLPVSISNVTRFHGNRAM